MLNLFLLSVFSISFSNIWVIAQNDRSYISPGNEDCGITFPMKTIGPITLKSPNYEPGTTCNWTFIGSSSCIPAISCSEFNFQKLDNTCQLEHLEVTDGTGACERYCGPVNPFVNPARSNSWTLYVNMKSAPRGPDKTKSFECTVRCTEPPSRIRPLMVKHYVPTIRVKEDLRCVCGMSTNDSRIVGGVDVGLNEIPWQVALVESSTREPRCGGSIINQLFILTAAHCVVDAEVEFLEILIHSRVLEVTRARVRVKNVPLGQEGSLQAPGQNESIKTDEEEGTIRIAAEEFFIHPLYNRDDNHYDIALIKLKNKIDFFKPDAPVPICLPQLGMKKTYDGNIARVSGWGLAHEGAGGSTRLLQRVDLPIIPVKVCTERLKSYPAISPVDETQICAGFKEGMKDACTGDSGGPLTFKKSNKQWEQIGVVSEGKGCARAKIPGLYTRVTEFTEWILRKASEGTWCRRKI